MVFSTQKKEKKSFHDIIIQYLQSKAIDTDDEIYLYLISFVVILFCALTHIYLLIVFSVNTVPVFVAINIASIIVYLIAIYLHKIKRYAAACLLISWEVSVYATFFAIVGGISTYIVGYYILVIILQLILPSSANRRPILMIAIMILIGLSAVICSFIFEPFVTFSSNLHMLLTFSNIFLLFIGTVVQLLIGNFIRRSIAENNMLRIETLSKEANTDHLTGLLNRRSAEPAFLEIKTAEEQAPFCIAMLDIDDFKVINDTLGHGCGDEVLVFLARFLKSNLRKSDLIFRWGGEEFLVILKNTAIGTAYTRLNKLRHRL